MTQTRRGYSTGRNFLFRFRGTLIAAAFVIALATTLTVANAAAVDLYVDCQNGDNTANGLTQATAFRSVTYAVNSYIPSVCSVSDTYTVNIIVPPTASATTPLCGPHEVADIARVTCGGVTFATVLKASTSAPYPSEVKVAVAVDGVANGLAFANALLAEATPVAATLEGSLATGVIPAMQSYTGVTHTVGSTGANFTTLADALASGSVVDGDILSLQAETFAVTAAIDVSKAVLIMGAGAGSTTLDAASDSAVASVLNIKVSGVAVTDLTVAQHVDTTSAAITVNGVSTVANVFIGSVNVAARVSGVVLTDVRDVVLNSMTFTVADAGTATFVSISQTKGVVNIKDCTFTTAATTTVINLPTGPYRGLIRVTNGAVGATAPAFFYHHTGWQTPVARGLNLEVVGLTADSTLGGGFMLDAASSGAAPLSTYASIILKGVQGGNALQHGLVSVTGVNDPVISPGTTVFYANTITLTGDTLADGYTNGGTDSASPYLAYDSAAFSNPSVPYLALPTASLSSHTCGSLEASGWNFAEPSTTLTAGTSVTGVSLVPLSCEPDGTMAFTSVAMDSIAVDMSNISGPPNAPNAVVVKNSVIGTTSPNIAEAGVCNGHSASTITAGSVGFQFIASSAASNAWASSSWPAPATLRGGCTLTVSSTDIISVGQEDTVTGVAVAMRGQVNISGSSTGAFNIVGGTVNIHRGLSLTQLASVTFTASTLQFSPVASDYTAPIGSEMGVFVMDRIAAANIHVSGAVTAQFIALQALPDGAAAVNAIWIKSNNPSAVLMKLPFTSLSVDPTTVTRFTSIVKMDPGTTGGVALQLTQDGGTLALPHAGYRFRLEEMMLHSPRSSIGTTNQGTVLYDFDSTGAVTLHVSPSVVAAHSAVAADVRTRLFEVVTQLPAPYDGSVDGKVWIRDDVYGATSGCANAATELPSYQNVMPDCGAKAGECVAYTDDALPTTAFGCATTRPGPLEGVIDIDPYGLLNASLQMNEGLIEGTQTPVRGTCTQPADNYAMGTDCSYQLGAGSTVIMYFVPTGGSLVNQTTINTLFGDATAPTDGALRTAFGDCVMAISQSSASFPQWWTPTNTATGAVRSSFGTNTMGTDFTYVRTDDSVTVATSTLHYSLAQWATCKDANGNNVFTPSGISLNGLTGDMIFQTVRPRYPLGYQADFGSAGLPTQSIVTDTAARVPLTFPDPHAVVLYEPVLTVTSDAGAAVATVEIVVNLVVTLGPDDADNVASWVTLFTAAADDRLANWVDTSSPTALTLTAPNANAGNSTCITDYTELPTALKNQLDADHISYLYGACLYPFTLEMTAPNQFIDGDNVFASSVGVKGITIFTNSSKTSSVLVVEDPVATAWNQTSAGTRYRPFNFTASSLTTASVRGDVPLVATQIVTYTFPTYAFDQSTSKLSMIGQQFVYTDTDSQPHEPLSFDGAGFTTCQEVDVSEYPDWVADGATGACAFNAQLTWSVQSVLNIYNQTVVGTVDASAELRNADTLLVSSDATAETYGVDASFHGLVTPVFNRTVYLDVSQPTVLQQAPSTTGDASISYNVVITIPVTESFVPLADQVWGVGDTLATFVQVDALASAVTLVQTSEPIACSSQLPPALEGEIDPFTDLPYIGTCGVRLSITLQTPVVNDVAAWDGSLSFTSILLQQLATDGAPPYLIIDNLGKRDPPAEVAVSVALPYPANGGPPQFITAPAPSTNGTIERGGRITFTIDLSAWIADEAATPTGISLLGTVVCVPTNATTTPTLAYYVAGTNPPATGGCFDPAVANNYTVIYGSVFDVEPTPGWDVDASESTATTLIASMNILGLDTQDSGIQHLFVNFIVQVGPLSSMVKMVTTRSHANAANGIAIPTQYLSTSGVVAVELSPPPPPPPAPYTMESGMILKTVLPIGIVSALLIIVVFIVLAASGRAIALGVPTSQVLASWFCCRRGFKPLVEELPTHTPSSPVQPKPLGPQPSKRLTLSLLPVKPH